MKKHPIALFLALSSLYLFADASELKDRDEPLSLAEAEGDRSGYSSPLSATGSDPLPPERNKDRR
ncbi:MAG: hypothetical protein KYX62_07990 [Pseudomonadota bacterium]|nr:hypothetical protein [Pseudomonadota bacterium]